MASDDVLIPHDPSTGKALEPIPCTSSPELQRIVGQARAAQRAWGGLSAEARVAKMGQVVSRFRDPDVAEGLAQSICQEMGKPIRHARAEVQTAANRTEAFFDRAKAACSDELAREGSIEVVTQWRPLGVVAVIGPWNFPVATPNNLIMSGLLTGNAVVFKPSEHTPRTGAMYAELVRDLLPQGLLGVVQGGGAVGAALVASDVNMIAFTGSIATGQAIMRAAAGSMKRLVLELGGKDPMIVLPGADLDAAADYAVRSSLANSGQVCVAAERVLVHRDVHDEFMEKVMQRVRNMKVGDPHDEQTELGPLANDAQRSIVLEQIRDARDRGAEIVVEGQSKSPGYYLEPTVIDGVTSEMSISKDETFGPVVAIERIDSPEQGLQRANATEYGLGASVWGPETDELQKLADQIEAGMVGVNRGLSAAAGAPWGGWKMSGFGYSRSVAGMRQFMVPRTMSRNVG